MLRWLIALLVTANLIAFGLASGALSPPPSSGPREPGHLNRQVRPEWLKTRPISAAEAGEQAIVGKPAPEPSVVETPLAH